MYGEKSQEKPYHIPAEDSQPELGVIIKKLQSIVNHYEGIVYDTNQKLQKIKKYEEPPTVEAGIEEQPESATEEINYLLFRLKDLNEMAEKNLRHLGEII